ncbi:MAG: hypothetical protein DRO89_05885, partial [Candidatus Altiarchaeales archaeon]
LTEGYSCSDIKAICDSAAEIPWEEVLKGGEERKIEMRDFLEVIGRYRTSLTPWYRSAEKQIAESGEEDLYKELLESIRKFGEATTSEERFREILEEEKSKLGMPSKEERDEINRLLGEKEKIEKKIENARMRYYNGQLDEDIFRKILEEYEKQLIEIDVEIDILKGKRVE